MQVQVAGIKSYKFVHVCSLFQAPKRWNK